MFKSIFTVIEVVNLLNTFMTQIYYFLYKTTNLVNSKIYIGKHKTSKLNDGYYGSGKLLKRAVAKYGIENFRTDIILFFDSEEEMNQAESDIVTEEFCLRKDNYNLCPGGHGGFGYINREGLRPPDLVDIGKKFAARMMEEQRGIWSPEYDPNKRVEGVKRYSQKVRSGEIKHKYTPHAQSEESKRKISAANKIKLAGENNSQFGTMWITNGIDNRKISKDDSIPDGWWKGRKIKDTK